MIVGHLWGDGPGAAVDDEDGFAGLGQSRFPSGMTERKASARAKTP
jgi:hypothetical protein